MDAMVTKRQPVRNHIEFHFFFNFLNQPINFIINLSHINL
jgi:hypothetical protein